MKVIDLINNSKKTAFSFEILPPLKGTGIEKLYQTVDTLREFDPKYINITTHRSEYVYKDLGNGLFQRNRLRRRPGTVAVAAAIQNKYNITVVPHILCSGSIDSIKKRPAANCGKRLPENPSGLGDDPENTRDWNSVRCGKQYVPAWKTGDTVYRINIRYNCNRSPGNDKYSGESEWNGGNRSWRRVDDNCRSVYGSGQKRRGGLLHKKIKCDRRSGNHCKLPAGICIDQACDSSWRHGACKCKDVFPYGNLDYACEADCMDAGICSGIRTSCGGRRKIFYDHVVSGHVAVPILSVRDTDPISGIWTDGRLDRYVCRLDSACSNIYMEIP